MKVVRSLKLVLLSTIVVNAVAMTVVFAHGYPTDTTAVHRFYKKSSGTHFYSASKAEVDRVKKQMASTYRYEGIAYYGYKNPGAGRQGLHRFYNRSSGTHFYTISQQEVNRIKSTMASKYRYEGVKYYVNVSSAGATTSVYRFYNKNTGTHFYTASSSEANRIKSTMPYYRYEVVAFPAVKQRYFANCTEARDKGAAPIYAYEPGYRLELDRDRDNIACEIE